MAIDDIDLEPDEVLYIRRFARNQRIKIPSLRQSWFTLEARLFLSQQFADDELMMIALAVYFMPHFYGKFDEIYIEPMFKKVLRFDALGAVTAAKKFWAEFRQIMEGEATLKSNYEPDEIQAGIERLNIFGEWGMVDSIAERLKMKHADVIKLPYTDCFLMMKKDFETSQYRSRYMKIISKR